MTIRQRAFPLLLLSTVLVLAGPACDSEPASTKPVVDLSDSEAQALCREFFMGACAAPLLAGDPACATCQPCTQSTSVSTIRTECGAGITVAGVRHCIDSGYNMAICTGSEGGGCMFDVGDALCPTP